MARGPLLRALHVELNFLSFLQGIKIDLLKATAVEEDLPAIVGMDEPESTVANKLLNCPSLRQSRFIDAGNN